MKILLRKGEHLWTPNGTHVWCEKGFAQHCQEDVEVEFVSQAVADEAVFFIKQERNKAGLDENTGLHKVVETPVVEPEVPVTVDETPVAVEPEAKVTPIKKKRKVKS